MSRFRTSVVGAVGLSLALAACGGGSDTSSSNGSGAPAGDGQKVTELNLYSSFNKGTPSGTLQAKVLEDFTKKTGIKVNVSDAVGDDAMEAYEAQVAAGKEADVVILNPTQKSRDWVANGAVVDAEPYFKQWGMEAKLQPNATDGWRDKDGKLLGIPYIGFEWPVYYNMAILKKVGITTPPATDTEMYAAASKLQSIGIPLFSAGGGDWTGGALYTHVTNAYIAPDAMTKVWSEGGYCKTPEVMKGIQYFVKMRDTPNMFPKNVQGFQMDQQNQTFFTGKAAAMSGGSWWFEDVPAAMRKDVVLGGVPVPADAHYKKPMAAHGSTSAGFFISPNGEKKADAVRQLIEAFYDQSVASKVVTDTAAIPVVKLDPKPTPKNPLLEQALNGFSDKVEYVPSVDNAMPASVQAKNPTVAAQVYSPKSTADSICKAYDDLY